MRWLDQKRVFAMVYHRLKSSVSHAFTSVHCCLVVTCWERADLLDLVGDIFLDFCYFPMRYPGSGVVLDLIVYRSLPSFFTLAVYIQLCH